MNRASVPLVDDDRRIQSANRDMFETLGYDVSVAMSLAEARRRGAAGTPDDSLRRRDGNFNHV